VRQVGELLRPNPFEAIRAYRLSRAVNNMQNDGPERTEPAG